MNFIKNTIFSNNILENIQNSETLWRKQKPVGIKRPRDKEDIILDENDFWF